LTLANWRENLRDPDIKRQSIAGSSEKRVVAMVAKGAPRIEPQSSKYYYRRSRLKGDQTLRAVGVGIAAGLAAFYIARIVFSRTPLVAPEETSRAPKRLRGPNTGGA
jgi:hypothetical protein